MIGSWTGGRPGEPATDPEPNIDTKVGAPPESRKRKRDSLDSSSTTEWFDAQVLSPTSAGPRVVVSFSPIATLLRAHLPLAWLAGTSEDASVRTGTVFQADIPTVARWDYHVLLARLLPNGGLFAIELVEPNVYVCHPIQHFVRTEWIERAAVGANPPMSLAVLIDPNASIHKRKPSSSTVSNLSHAQTTVQNFKQPTYRRGILARQSILTRTKSLDITEPAVVLQEDVYTNPERCESQQETVQNDAQETHSDSGRVHLPQNLDQPDKPILYAGVAVQETAYNATYSCESANTVSVPMTDQIDQLSPEYLRKRYLEMLYLSKTSLAFYAKGPLSRTRARARASDATMDLESLAAFYRDSILPIKKFDLKYKDSVKNKILCLQASFANAECAEIRDPGDRRVNVTKKNRRTKFGKDALWPMEDEFIEKWWLSREVRHRPSASMAEEIADSQHLFSVLRMREMELQIILILEVLSLETREATKSQANNHENAQSLIKMETTDAADQGMLADTPRSKKKPRDLFADLEALLDRLCILHSVGIEDLVAPGDTVPGGPEVSPSRNKDMLSDFCKDVIIPFYASKLPDQCRSVCRKLGGLELSPNRPKSTVVKPPVKANSTSSQLLEQRVGYRRTLQRVLSEEDSIRHPSPPVLSRSYTVPADSLKREPSERPVSRGGMRKSGSFTNREIDLVADAQATAVKKRKLDQIVAQKRELDAAIATLKKPHRTALAQTFMDDLEKRQMGKKASGTEIDPVQIVATPKASRARAQAKSAVADEYELPPILGLMDGTGESLIPSSTAKPRGLHHLQGPVRSSAQKRAVLSAIHDTPSRRTDPKRMGRCPEPAGGLGLHTGPANQSSSTLVNSTPARVRVRPESEHALASTPAPIGSSVPSAWVTPSKRPEPRLEEVFKDAPGIPERANRMMDRVMQSQAPQIGTSIYDSLGWNDDYDL